MKKEKLDIIYEDKSLIVINKKAHLLTVGTEKEKINTLYHKTYEYIKKQDKNNKIFIVHRLDKDTSGIVVFAKNEKLKKALQDDWNDLAYREYLAIVEGNVKEDKGTIKVYLKDTKTLKTIVVDEKEGKLAITNYEVIKRSKNYSILKIIIETGRKNQIRASLAHIKHPIIGDTKYGSTKNPLRRICLHHELLKIKNPLTNKEMEFKAKIPESFKIFK